MKGNKSSETIPPHTSIDENNQSQMHDHEKVECLNSYFTSVSSITTEPPLIPDLVLKTYSKLDSIAITEEEVIDILEFLNTNKASGPDLISNKMLKNVTRSIAKPLAELFNRLLLNHKFPDRWKFSRYIII